MSSLHQLFISKDNVTYIISKSIERIQKARRVVNPKNKDFYDTFNTVASKIFGYETNRLKHMNVNEALKILNNIVIQEFSEYIIKKQQQPLHQPQKQKLELPQKNQFTEDIQEGTSSRQVPADEKVKENTFKLCLQDSKIHFSTPITNLSKIEFLTLHMYNKDYIITEFNNTLKLSNDEVIVVQPGNYNNEKFIEAVQKQTTVSVSICDITGQIKFEGVDINDNASTMQEIIGYRRYIEHTEIFPMKLLKRHHINFGITMVYEQNYTYEETDEQTTHIEPIILKDSDKIEEYPLNIVKIFDKDQDINLKEISLDFDNFNHRGYPFYVLINISYIE